MCSIRGCDAEAVAKGLCAKHYMRARRTGDPTQTRKPGPAPLAQALPQRSPRTQARYRGALSLIRTEGERVELTKAASRASGSLNVARLVELAAKRHREPVPVLLLKADRKAAEATIRSRHYTRSIPSGKSYYVAYDSAIVVWSVPANYTAAKHFLPGVEDPVVFELTRLWAPDGHAPNLLTKAISAAVGVLKQVEPDVDLAMSYADPSAGHRGFVYRASSWIEVGRSEEVRAWCRKDGAGPIPPRRAFHSGDRHLNKPDIEALGFTQLKLPGKHRFVQPLSRRAKRLWQSKLAL